MSNKALSIYMDDHYAMLCGEVELANRVASENQQNDLGPYLTKFAHELDSQRNLLQALLATQGESPSTAKQALTWVAEKIGRLKPNDGWSEYTNLARVLELEVLISATQARVLMWKTLDRVLTDQEADKDKVESAEHDSEKQLKSLKKFHKEAQQQAFPVPEE